MHDAHFARKIMLALEDKIDESDRSKAIVVHAKLSPFSHVTAESLDRALHVILSETDFKDVRLEITPAEYGVRCGRCGREYREDKTFLSKCRFCSSDDLSVDKGLEFYIDYIEIF